MLSHLDPAQIALVAVLFVWTGFVRSGLGFGGAALGLPLLLFVDDRPLLWLPIIGIHLLFFSALTLRTRIRNVHWAYLRQSGAYVLPAAVVGVLGLISLPTRWLLLFIYSVTLFYSLLWVSDRAIHSQRAWLDRALLVLGGYIAGTTLSGAPLMVAVFMRNVPLEQLRNTFYAFGVDLQLVNALALLPVAAIGHLAGLKAHDAILRNDRTFRRWIGAGLMVVSLLGLWKLW
jgi:hypothetical protein